MSRALRFIRLFQLFCPGDYPVNLVLVGPRVDCNSIVGVMFLHLFLCSPIITSQGLAGFVNMILPTVFAWSFTNDPFLLPVTPGMPNVY